MKIDLDLVQFDFDVPGPGPKTQREVTSTYVRNKGDRDRHLSPLRNYVIYRDLERESVLLCIPDAKDRPVVEVPWTKVRYSEPSVKQAKEQAGKVAAA